MSKPSYSTIAYFFVVNQLQEKANEYNIPLCFAFVDYQKAFDSIRFKLLFEGLKNQGVDEACLNLLRNVYSEATSVLRLYKESEKVKLEKEPDKKITSLPNCSRYICNMPSSTRSTGKTKVSGLAVNTYPTLSMLVIYSSQPSSHQSLRKCSKIFMTSASHSP